MREVCRKRESKGEGCAKIMTLKEHKESPSSFKSNGNIIQKGISYETIAKPLWKLE